MADFTEMGAELEQTGTPELAASDPQATLYSMGEPFETVGGSSVARSRRVLQRVRDTLNNVWCYFVDTTPNVSPAPNATKPVHSGQLGAHEVLADHDPDLEGYALAVDLDALQLQIASAGLSEAQVQSLIAAGVAGKADASALAAKADASALAAKADASALAAKADAAATTTALAGKANTSTVQALDSRVELVETYGEKKWSLRVVTAAGGITALPGEWIIAYNGVAVALPTTAPNGSRVAVTMLGETGSVSIQWNPARMGGDGQALAMDEVAGHEATRMFVYVALLSGWINYHVRGAEHSYTGGGGA